MNSRQHIRSWGALLLRPTLFAGVLLCLQATIGESRIETASPTHMSSMRPSRSIRILPRQAGQPTPGIALKQQGAIFIPTVMSSGKVAYLPNCKPNITDNGKIVPATIRSDSLPKTVVITRGHPNR
ncbi:MAG TPA: hypothetical protein VGM23_18235 [Armatimonadota bacterium]